MFSVLALASQSVASIMCEGTYFVTEWVVFINGISLGSLLQSTAFSCGTYRMWWTLCESVPGQCPECASVQVLR